MPSGHSNDSGLPSFILMAFSVNNVGHTWISIPLCVLCLLSGIGNGLFLFIIKTDSQLGEPMYVFLSMLAATDLCVTLATLPTALSVLWFDLRYIHVYSCLTQMFCIHTMSLMGSAILLAMSFDRYVAICNPLRYTSILRPLTAKIGLVAIARAVCLELPLPILLSRLPFCENKNLTFPFCYHSDIIKLACADTSINSMYGLVLVLSTYLVDSLFILISYFMILRTVLGIASKEERLKTFSTCVSHICVVLVFYVPLIGLAVVQRYSQNVSPLLIVLMGFALLCIPPSLNPIIYSMKTKKIQYALRKHFCVERRNM
ncbi:olfactory receptor 51G2-like [Ambystoma mexicanum]|uniref:olfactory receptor 51G2-like n=1 Tax=Ambystoma mexicanum TaxID=8296 RepID=UPI0037E7283A